MSDTINFEIVKHPDSSLYRFSATSLDYLAPHFHNDFEFLLPIHGKGTLVASGKAIPSSTGDLCIFNPGEVHEIRTNGNALSFLCLQISPQYFKNLLGRSDRMLFDVQLLHHAASLKQVGFLNALLIEFGYQFFREQRHGKALYSALLNLFAYSLLQYCPYHLLSEAEFLQIKARNARIVRIVNFVERNYQRKLLLSDLARTEGLSTGYLSSFFRQNFNQTFQDYVTTVRFSHAKSLIFSDKRILDISYEAGFSDPRYLAKAFLKYEGCSPTAYREQRTKPLHTDLSLGTGGFLAENASLEPDRLLQLLKSLRMPLGGALQQLLDTGFPMPLRKATAADGK